MQFPIPSRRRTDGTSEASETERLLALIADDDPEFGAYISVLARRLGFKVVYASDGTAALVAVSEHSFDLLLIDYSMPRMDGVEVIRAIRADERTRDVYAVIVTAHDEIESKLTALGAGYDDFMSKSASEAEIVAKLASARRMLLRHRDLDDAVRKLYGLATRDELTGVFNRRFFIEESERALREREQISMVLFDLNDFKIVNDTHGHLAGDQILRDVGALFLRTTRSEDLIARFGGDEFVMLLTGIEADQVERIAARIAGQIRSLLWSAGSQPVGIGVSIGIGTSALLPDATLSQLLNAADRDLYKNKWVAKHPEQRPELYQYPDDRAADGMLTLKTDDECGEREKERQSGRTVRRAEVRNRLTS